VFVRQFVADVLAGDATAIKTRGSRVLIEHTSINPNASPHVGRGRNAIIGDTIARLFRFLGHQTEVHYYVNDIGKQIALLVYACRGRDDLQFNDLLDEYVAISQKAKDDPAVEQIVKQLGDRSLDILALVGGGVVGFGFVGELGLGLGGFGLGLGVGFGFGVGFGAGGFGLGLGVGVGVGVG